MNWRSSLVVSVVLVLCGLTVFTAAQGKKMDRVQRIKVNVGHSFTISLDSNPSTGYTWQILNPINQSLLKTVNKTFTPDKKLVGSPGKENWEFKGMRKGTVYIMMAYKRNSDKKVSKKTTYAVVIQ